MMPSSEGQQFPPSDAHSVCLEHCLLSPFEVDPPVDGLLLSGIQVVSLLMLGLSLLLFGGPYK